MSFPETRRFIEQPETLARLRRTQAEYFDRLLAGDCHWRYALDRLRAGAAHRRAEARAVFVVTMRCQSVLTAASRRAAMRPRRGTSVRSASSTSRACSATCTRCTPVAGAAAAGRPA